jgi:hypothetical protein
MSLFDKNVSLKDWETSMKQIIRFVEYTGEILEDLQKRVETLEKQEPKIINNYYTYPAIQPTRLWDPHPQYPTWTCKNDTGIPPTNY